MYEVHADILKSLLADLIVTQSQCEVCAVSVREVERVVSEWLDSPARIVSLEPDALADVWEDIRRVANALDVPEKGVELVGDLTGRADEIVEITRGLPENATVGCVEWIDPLMTGGNWIPELVDTAGSHSLSKNH